MIKKKLAIYFSDAEPMGYPFDKIYYFEIYQEIIKEVESKGIEVFIVRGNSYLKNGIFSHGWKFVDGNLIEEREIKVDLIFNRDDKNTIPRIDDCPIINHPDLDELCIDKYKTSQLFPEFSPETSYVHSFGECLEVVSKSNLGKEEKIILKKNFETEGRGISVIKSNELKSDLYSDWSDILVQEFLDASVGIDGLVDGLHDFRIAVVNDVEKNAYIRVPAPGILLANVALGASGFSVPIEKIPDDLEEIMVVIRGRLKKYFPNVYSVDFLNTKDGFKLIELNSRPSVQHPDWVKTYKVFNDAVVKMLIEAINN